MANKMCRAYVTDTLAGFSLMVLTIFLLPSLAFSRDLQASLAYLPTLIDDENSGGYVEFLKAIDREYQDGRILRKVYPFQRSIANVVYGQADFHMPLLVNPLVDEESLPYRYSSEDIGFVVFVLYSRADRPLSRKALTEASYRLSQAGLDTLSAVEALQPLAQLQDKNYPNPQAFTAAARQVLGDEQLFNRHRESILKAAFPFLISTERVHVPFFSFPVKGSLDIERSLRMLERKRIDGFIFAQEESDALIRKLHLKHIHRSHFQTFDVRLVLPKGVEGDDTDQRLSAAIRKLKQNGEHRRLVEQVHAPYNDWQPIHMESRQ